MKINIDEHKSQTPRMVEVNGQLIGLNLDPALQTAVLRSLTGTTPLDTEVDNLPLPRSPFWLRTVIRLLQWYRLTISPRLGQRCVYEPSCSRYSELVLRKYGLVKGISLTVKRLHRCRSGAGGIDIP